MALEWESDFVRGLERAKKEKKPILVEFFNPACIGCKQMDDLTFSVADVSQFLEKRTVPLRVSHTDKVLTEKYGIKWTPTILLLDAEGKEHHRTVGFLPSDDFVASVLLGAAKMNFDLENFDEASRLAGEILSMHPSSSSAPEAVFLKGVCGFKVSGNRLHLKDAYEHLSKFYPQSEWTKRAYPYRLI